MDFEPHKIAANPLFAGMAGALVGLRFAPGISWLERATNVAAGAACSGFVAPAAGEMLRLSSPSMLGFLAFVIGMFGMSLASAMMQGLRDLEVSKIITGWVSRKP